MSDVSTGLEVRTSEVMSNDASTNETFEKGKRMSTETNSTLGVEEARKRAKLDLLRETGEGSILSEQDAEPAVCSNPIDSKRNEDVLQKYKAQRLRLFSLFDQGIRLDEESWYSVTPEKIAEHIASRFYGQDVILDMFSGAGGNSIQFAISGAYVISVERDAKKIDMARNNAKIYNVDQYIEFIHGDVYEILPTLQKRQMPIDAVFMSPPWGGPEYLNALMYDVSVFKRVVDLAKSISDKVCILIPRTVQMTHVEEVFGSCEYEVNYINQKAKTVSLYFGGLMGTPPLANETLALQ